MLQFDTNLLCIPKLGASKMSSRQGRTSSPLMSDFPRFKALWFFKSVLDADGNGYTNEEDFVRIALVHAVMFCKGAYFKDIYDMYIRNYQEMWSELARAADTNQDGVITFQEWHSYVTTLRSRVRSFEDLPEFLKKMIENHFSNYDENHDGQIDINEYRLYLCGKNMDLKLATDCFQTLLTGKDQARGTINKKEFCALMFDFLFSTQPNSGGTYICGPLQSVKSTVIDVYTHLAGV
ncbi:hypothetical protein RvY_01286 [Ramazzottius varieornatus]|uniref:EF-hand domain-containing protein n=1 Tax=Ramazzottius varieornatus TaxID=947166 RepID=A0A1D1UR23_RAMVA|nr:hypothetical protein RvY_01286 [Ramazzottius varieornatus]